MCGRYTLRKGFTEVATHKGSYRIEDAASSTQAVEPRYNIAPTQQNLVLIKSFSDTGALKAATLRWGLIPSWSKTAQTLSPMINARSESVAEKPAFKAAFQRRRCLVPADGYYEWKKRGGASQPYFFHFADEAVFFMAGIWEVWRGESGEQIESYTILTTEANADVSKYHDRMPVILTEDSVPVWLEADMSSIAPAERDALLAPLEAGSIVCRPANPVVNNNRNEGPACTEAPATVPLSQLDLGF